MSELQSLLGGLELPAATPPVAPERTPAPRLKTVNRNQMIMRPVDVERLIEEDHPARAVWEFTGRLDLSSFAEPIESVEGVAGRPNWDPRLLMSVWIYALSLGVGSAREIARRCAYDPAFQWLTGLEIINYHTLSDFRSAHGPALTELFSQGLGVLSAEGLVSLERVMHDGTKIRACAGADSFRREERIRMHLEAARAQVATAEEAKVEDPPAQRAARQRAARERQARLEQALEELEKIRASKDSAQDKDRARVSSSDPQARIMKQGDGGYAPSYNAQISTEASHKIIVAVGVSQNGSDYGELMPAAARLQENMGQKPGQIVADGGFTSRQNIMDCAAEGIDFIGSLGEHAEQSTAQMRRREITPEFYPEAFQYDAAQDSYLCPAGEVLRHQGEEKRPGVVKHQYRAEAGVCQRCPFRQQCCPKNDSKGRSIARAVEAAPVQLFRKKMQTEPAQAIYRQRGEVAEFPHAWIKAKIGLRQFRLRGLIKVRIEALWACLTYNIQQWIRLRWHPQVAPA